MTNFDRVRLHLTDHPGWCDDCISHHLSISPRQTVNGVCSKKGSGISRSKAVCASCGKHKTLNHLATHSGSNQDSSQMAKRETQINKRYVREEDLSSKLNHALINTLGVAREDYYGRLDFDHLLLLKEGLARINDIVTMKLTFAMVDRICQRLCLSAESHAALRDKVNALHPNTAGFDVDSEEPNLIAEIKGCIPVNGGNVFGAAQVRGLDNDVLQMLGQPAHGKSVEKLSKKTKLIRPSREGAIKLLGLYDSQPVRDATAHWRSRLMASKAWESVPGSDIQDLPETGALLANTVYLVYLKPVHRFLPFPGTAAEEEAGE